MEDDDDFGDLYTDVLQNFPSAASQPSGSSSSSFALPPPPQQRQQRPSDSPQSDRPGLDLNLQLKDEDEEEYGDDDARISISGAAAQTLAPHVSAPGLELNLSPPISGGAKGGGNFNEESFRFDLEEEAQDGNGDVGLGPVIPGLSTGPGGSADHLGREEAGADDWDSDDSEDDLQIVLNETTQDPMALEMGHEDNGQNEGLGIGADGHGVGFQHPGMEEQEWGDDEAQAADGEKKEGAEMTKLNQGIYLPPNPGYAGRGYHTFHSQFKYVRPGAAPLQGAPAAGSVGAPGLSCPIINLGPTAGRGRGDWRPTVMKNVPGMQKGYGGPGWGNSGGGRGLGIGLDFTLPSHKTIFEVDIDGFEEKPWNNPGVDVTDFFNFSLTEESWKGYCKQLEQFRLASTMQSRIRVYESGRLEQAYDPDMHPELAAAADVSDSAAENVNFRTDVDHTDMAKSSAPARPTMPPGRQIQVETGSGERLPSIDTRPPRMRELDAIEIECDGFAEGQLSEDDAPQSTEHDDSSKTNRIENHGSEGVPEQSKCGAVHSSEERIHSSPVNVHHHSGPSGPGEHNPVHSSGSTERHSIRQEGESLQLISQGDNMQDDQSDGSIDRVDGKRNVLVSPGSVKDDQELNAGHINKDDDDPHSAVKPAALEDDNKYDKIYPGKNQYTVSPRSKRQTVASHIDLTSGQDYGEDLKATRNGDNRKPSAESSKEYMKSHIFGEEVVQVRRGESMRNRKRHLDDDERNIQKRNHNERHVMERSRDVLRGREDPPVHRVGGLAKPSYVTYDFLDKKKERDDLGVGQRRDENPHGKRTRTNDYRKQDPWLPEHGDGMGSRYSSKAWDGDRIEKEDHLYLRKQIDTGNLRVHHDKDVGLRQRERDESLKERHEHVDNYKRRKREENPRRDYSEKEELLLSRKGSPGLRKRKEDHLDQRRLIDQERTRENFKDHRSVRLKDDVRMEREKSERPNERDDRHRTKEYLERSLTRREREDVRKPIRSWRGKEKDEINDVTRFAESKRRDQVDDLHLLNHRVHDDKYAHGTNSSILVSKLRKDGLSSHTDHNASNNHKIIDEKPKDSARNKEHDSRSQNSQTISKRVKSDHSSHKIEKIGTNFTSGQGNTVHQTEGHPNSTRKSGAEPATDDDEQQQSKKGRSKMERWTSHKEKDFEGIAKPVTSLKGKERIKSSINTEFLVSAEPADNPTKPAESIDLKPPIEEKALQGVDTKKDNIKEAEHKNSDPLQTADEHLDTVAKLKKRSERFKLPLPSEKEATNKNKETEALLRPQTEAPPADAEVKSERPPRKRRWISS